MEDYLDKRNGEFTEKFSTFETGSNDDNRDTLMNTIKLAKEEIDQLRLENDNSNINGASIVQIEEWKKIDEKFVSTDLCENVIKQMEEYNVITVYGKSGIGKSATIHHVALVLQDKSQYEIVPCRSPKDIEKKFKKNARQVFVFDGVCGRYSAIQDVIDSWLGYESFLMRIARERNVKVIVSCRLQVFKEEQFQRICFLKECAIEFTDNLITPDQKRSIFEKYLDSDLIPAIGNAIYKCDFFPLMCSLYRKDTQQDIVKFFENPFDIYMSEFDSIKQDQNKMKYFTIILIVLCNGELRFSDKQDTDSNEEKHEKHLKNLIEDCGIFRETPKTVIKMHLDSLVGTFLKTEYYHNNVGKYMVIYRPIHAKLFVDYMCHHCGLHFQNVIIKYATSSLLSQRTRFESLASTEEAPIIIRTENEVDFFSRMMQDILEDRSEYVFRNSQMKCPEYRHKLIRYLNCNADLLKSILKDTHIGRKVLFEILASNYSDLISFAESIQGSLISMLDLAYCTEQNFFSKYTKKFKNLKTPSISIDKFRYTPVVCASYYGHTEMVKVLLSKGASINCNASHRQLTPLSAAKAGNNSYIVDIILNNNELGVNTVNNRQFSPLMMACSFGKFSMVCSLVDKGASVNSIDKCGHTALMFASRYGFVDIVQYLCQFGADIMFRSSKRWTSLMFACKGGHTAIVEYLIEKGSSVNNEIDVHGASPFHIAAKHTFWDLCMYLLQMGANDDLIDDDAVFAITKSTETEDNSTDVPNIRSDRTILNKEMFCLPLDEVIELEDQTTYM
ncbi:uncharacterized protein LOC127714959 [Mytilus californianus]|uniref:uncharacterized protein LOC127714959 n=1 Tax=Mytilus californianus TaxID=6549 RepID=UPI0022474519|nr:uncharacterized protein LOC127714959 [Mytilus californianus]